MVLMEGNKIIRRYTVLMCLDRDYGDTYFWDSLKNGSNNFRCLQWLQMLVVVFLFPPFKMSP